MSARTPTRIGSLPNRLSPAGPSDAQYYVFNATSGLWTPVSMSGDATQTNAGAVTLAISGVAAGSTADIGTIPRITFDAKGRATAQTKFVDFAQEFMGGMGRT